MVINGNERDDQQNTIMQGVHMIVAFPQWYINYNLDMLLKNGKTQTGGSLQNVSLQFRNKKCWLHGTISKIWTNIYVNGATNKVKFIISFLNGEMDYYDLTMDPPEKKQTKIDGLQFGFDVDLGYENLENNQTIPDNVKTEVEKLLNNYGEGAVTIQQLFMDFQNAVLGQYDPTVTEFPSSMDANAQEAFKDYLGTYMNQLQSVGGNILGYAVKVNNPGSVDDPVATFPPTSLHFVTNQYQGAGSELNTNLDTINYLMMTEGQPLPKIQNNYWGNFIVPGNDVDGKYGVMALSNDLFIKRFMIQKTSQFVNKYWTFNNVDNSLIPVYIENTGDFILTPDGGIFSSGIKSGHTKANDNYANFNFSVDTKLSAIENTNKIFIERSTNFDIEVVHKGIFSNSSYKLWYHVPLTITIELCGINDGKLAVEVSSKTTEPDPDFVYSEPYGWMITKDEGNPSIWKSVGNEMDNYVTQLVNTAVLKGTLPQVKNEIENSLRLESFVFPYGSQLFMSDPIFNHERDLLIALKYKM